MEPRKNAFPTAIGFIPTGVSSNDFDSRSVVTIGRNLLSSFEAIGYGPQARPDVVEHIQLNLSYKLNPNDPFKTRVAINLDVSDLVTIAASNTNFNALKENNYLNMKFVEVSVCESGTERRRVALLSDSYDAPPET